MLEESNSCPAFIERQEGPFTTSYELQSSPNMSRLSNHFSSSFLGTEENDENQSYTLNIDTPPTPPYRKSSFISPKRTPPSPTVLRDISNTPASGVPHFIKRRCYSPTRRSNSISHMPVRRLQLFDQEGMNIDTPVVVPLPSMPSTSYVPALISPRVVPISAPVTLNSRLPVPSLSCPSLSLSASSSAIPAPTNINTRVLPSRKRPCLTSSTSSLPDFFKVRPDRMDTSSSLVNSDSAVAPISSDYLEEKHEVEERVRCVLPTIPGSCPDFNRIDGNTVNSILAGEYDDKVEKFVIMDCRYEYEYNGGHIKTAISMSPERIFDYFRAETMPEPVRASHSGKRTVIIMHCEFSSKRAPDCIRLLRQYDRSVNQHRGYKWPLCSYPDVYLLDGGYKGFFGNHIQQCEPPCYVPEKHKSHTQSRSFHKRTRKEQLRRTQSFSI